MTIRSVRRPVPADHYKSPLTGNTLFNSKGEINASNKMDALKIALAALEAHQQGLISAPESAEDEVSPLEEKKQALASLVQAFNSKNKDEWMKVGAELVALIKDVSTREGMMRVILPQAEVSMHNVPRIALSKFSAAAVVTVGPGRVDAQLARHDYYYPPEFNIFHSVEFEASELYTAAPSLIDDKREEALAAFMVAEDRQVKQMLDFTVGMEIPDSILIGGLTPRNFRDLLTEIEDRMLPPSMVWMPMGLANDFTVGTDFAAYVDPVTKYDMIRQGRVTSMFGVNIYVEAVRHPLQRVLDRDEMYVLTTPEYLGAYTEREENLRITEIDKMPLTGMPGRGFTLYNRYSMFVGGLRGVVHARRQ